MHIWIIRLPLSKILLKKKISRLGFLTISKFCKIGTNLLEKFGSISSNVVSKYSNLWKKSIKDSNCKISLNISKINMVHLMGEVKR